jgi:hypothetical protein
VSSKAAWVVWWEGQRLASLEYRQLNSSVA